MKIIVVTPVYNSQKYILQCINSFLKQTYKNKLQIIVNDCSTDLTHNFVEPYSRRYKNDLIYANSKVNGGALASHLIAMKIIEQKNLAKDEDIIVHLDGDDNLIDEKVLEFVAKFYTENTKFWLTYGDYISTDGSPSVNKSATNNNFRDKILNGGWCYSHLRTFKWHLWKKLDKKDLLDENGRIYTSAGDVAIMTPLLEMAGCDRVIKIAKPLMIYNRDNPLNEDKKDLSDQVRCAISISSKKPYERVT